MTIIWLEPQTRTVLREGLTMTLRPCCNGKTAPRPYGGSQATNRFTACFRLDIAKLADRDVDHPGMLITHKSQHSHTKHVLSLHVFNQNGRS